MQICVMLMSSAVIRGKLILHVGLSNRGDFHVPNPTEAKRGFRLHAFASYESWLYAEYVLTAVLTCSASIPMLRRMHQRFAYGFYFYFFLRAGKRA